MAGAVESHTAVLHSVLVASAVPCRDPISYEAVDRLGAATRVFVFASVGKWSMRFSISFCLP